MFGLGKSFEYLECEKCGCVQIANYPADMVPYYPRDYYSYGAAYGAHRAGLKARLLAARKNLSRVPELLLRQIRGFVARRRPWVALYTTRLPNPDARILDVGCGDGTRMRSLRDLGYVNALGIDPFLSADLSHAGRLLARKASLNEIDGPFDCISFHHVLEHMPHQHEVLRQVRALLSPTGFVIIRVPVAGSSAWRTYREKWVQLDAPRHFYLHTPSSLHALAEACGFTVESLTHDSTALQFWGSELYERGIRLNDPRSPAVGGTLFPPEQMTAWETQAEQLNQRSDGDQVVVILRPRIKAGAERAGAENKSTGLLPVAS